MGELHLDVLVTRLTKEMKVEAQELVILKLLMESILKEVTKVNSLINF